MKFLKRDLTFFLTFLMVLSSIAMGVFLALHSQVSGFKAKADTSQASIQFVNSNGSPISQTSSSQVKLLLNSGSTTQTSVSFKIANSIADLTNASVQSLTQSGQIVSWNLPSNNSGTQMVYAQFLVNGQWTNSVSASINLVSSVPLSSPSPSPNSNAGTNCGGLSFDGHCLNDQRVQNIDQDCTLAQQSLFPSGVRICNNVDVNHLTTSQDLLNAKSTAQLADNSISKAGGCQSNCVYDPNATPVPLTSFYSNNSSDPNSFASDCASGCTYPNPNVHIPYIYYQGNVRINDPSHNCGSPAAPSSYACGPTSLAMIAEAFNGEDPNQQTADNLTNFFLASGNPPIMSCTGTTNERVQNWVNLNNIDNTFQIAIVGQGLVDGNFSDLEYWWNETGWPILVGGWWGGIDSSLDDDHYMVVAGISNNYVWVADPLLPTYAENQNNGQMLMKVPLKDFVNNFFGGDFWEIGPVPKRNPPELPGT